MCEVYIILLRLYQDQFMPTSIRHFSISNSNGLSVGVLNLGGIITSIKTPDRNGNLEDIVLGFNDQELYLGEHPYFGALVGRYANRIANGIFPLSEQLYSLAKNNGQNHLHGGIIGFDKVFWNVEPFEDSAANGLKLSYFSKDKEEGYPGNLSVDVTYLLTDDNTLKVRYQAQTDKPTVVNLTQHSYFNLSADFSKSIGDHELRLNASQFLPVNKNQIPTGEMQAVANSPFDFRKAKPIGQDIKTQDEQLEIGHGYDHCWVLKNKGKLEKVAEVYHPKSGRLLDVFTDLPGIQLYTANFLDHTLPSKTGGTYGPQSGFCLETQHFPDAPNQPHFPTTILQPGQTFVSETWFRFGTKNNNSNV